MSITFKLVNVNHPIQFFLWIGQCLSMVDGVVLDLKGFDSPSSLPAYPDSLIILGNILLTWHSDGLRSRGLNWRRVRSWTWHACLILSEYPLLNFIFAASLRSNSHSLCPDWACSLKPTDASQQVSIIALIRGPARSWVTFQHGNVRYLNAGTFHKGVRMLPENWVLLLVGVKPRKPNQAKEREKEGSIITCSK